MKIQSFFAATLASLVLASSLSSASVHSHAYTQTTDIPKSITTPDKVETTS